MKEAIIKVKNLGGDIRLSEEFFQRYETVVRTSSQSEEIIACLDKAGEEIERLHKEELDIMFGKLLVRGKPESSDYRNMIGEIKSYKKAGGYSEARFLLMRALELDENYAGRGRGSCFMVPIIHHGRYAYKLRNSQIEAIIWEEGGRLISFKVNGVPVFKQGGSIDEPGSKYCGGYEDGGKKWGGKSNLENWETKIVKDSPEEVSLSFSKELSKAGEEGYVITRIMSIKKNAPLLKITYTIKNPSDRKNAYIWRAHTTPGIGKARDNEGGDPSGDEFIIPTDEVLPFMEYDSYKTNFDKMVVLNKPFAGVYDKKERAAVFFALDEKIKKLYCWIGPGRGYTFEPWFEFNLPARGRIRFTNYLYGLSGVRSKEEAEIKSIDIKRWDSVN